MMTELEKVIDRGDRGRKWFLIAIALVCAGIVGGIAFAIVVNVNQGKQLSKIESPCLKYGPDSKQCEEAFSAAVSTITHPQACAIERKAGTLKAIRELAAELGVEFTEPCVGARIEQERVRGKERAATDRQRSGGDAPTGSTGTLQPGPRNGGFVGDSGGEKEHPHNPQKGGAPSPAPVPDPQTVPSGSAPNSSPGRSGDASGDPDPPASPSPGTVPAAVEGVGKAVEDTGASAGGAVKETGKAVDNAVDCALRGSC